MQVLDSKNARAQIDRDDVYRALAHFPDQASEAWEESMKVSVPKRSIKSVVVVGMGASALGAHIIRTVFADRLGVPVEVVSGYDLPGSVGKNTLVLLSSYSGTTEEVLSCFSAAKRKKAILAGICSGGTLGKRLRAARIPSYIFSDPKWNPGDRPRLGLGYSIFGMIGLFKKFSLLSLKTEEIKDAIRVSRRTQRRNAPDVAASKNPAKKLARALKNQFVMWIASEHIEGAAHAIQNMTNESGKHFGVWRPIPELNHHLMEGLGFPKPVVQKTTAVLLSSQLYHPRVQKRYPLTADVFKQNNVKTEMIRISAKTRLSQSMEALTLGAHVTYYLGLLHHINPSPNPWVDYFKQALGRP